jgi:hypothetical protein
VKTLSFFLCAGLSLALLSCSRSPDVNGVYKSSDPVATQTYDFRSDGTLYYVGEWSAVGIVDASTVREEGKWRLQGNKLVVDRTKQGGGRTRQFEFTFEPNGDLLQVPSEGGSSRPIRFIKN